MDDNYRNKKIEEGQQLLKNGQKFLETSIWKMKTTPDWDSAATEFEKAATCFKVANDPDLAISASLKAADAYLKTRSEFHCAKMKEQAGYMCKEKKDMQRCCDLITEASNHYLNCGETDTASQCLEKCAKSIDQNLSSEPSVKLAAVTLLKKCFQLGQVSNRSREAAQALDYASKILVSLKRFEEALELCEQSWVVYDEMGNANMKFRIGLHIALLHLEMGNPDGALDAAHRVGTVDGELCGELANLVDAFKDGDQKTVSSIVLGQNFVYTENEFAKLGKNLKVPEEARLRFERNPVQRNPAASVSTGNKQNNFEFDEDDLS